MASPGRQLPPPKANALLLEWLLEILQPTNRTRVKQLLRGGLISVNGLVTTRHDHPLTAVDRVTIATHSTSVKLARKEPTPPTVFEDHAILAIDKPAGLLTVATEGEKQATAFAQLSLYLQARKAGRPYVVHRLDRETSGLLLFARSPEIRDHLQANWDAVEKTYLAIVEGVLKPIEGVFESFLTEGRDLRVREKGPGPDAKWSVTRYRVLSVMKGYSFVEVKLETGRKHQIRVHLAGRGCPVIGDSLYGARSNPAGRLGLHASRLAFPHPVDVRRIELQAELPARLKAILGR